MRLTIGLNDSCELVIACPSHKVLQAWYLKVRCQRLKSWIVDGKPAVLRADTSEPILTRGWDILDADGEIYLMGTVGLGAPKAWKEPHNEPRSLLDTIANRIDGTLEKLPYDLKLKPIGVFNAVTIARLFERTLDDLIDIARAFGSDVIETCGGNVYVYPDMIEALAITERLGSMAHAKEVESEDAP